MRLRTQEPAAFVIGERNRFEACFGIERMPV
jgi:hypothetical protein